MRAVLVALLLVPCLASLAARNAAQSASYAFFGEDCAYSPVPFSVAAVPRLGQRFIVESGLSDGKGCADGCVNHFVLTGDSNVSFLGVPLPFDLQRIGQPSCGLLRVSVLHTALARGPNARDRGEVVFPIPNDPGLLGATFYQQVLSVSCDMYGCSRRFSRGGVGVIGR